METQVEALDWLAKRQERSRAALIRDAVDEYLGRHGHDEGDEAFGSWGKDAPDGRAYEEQVRREW